MNSTELNYVYRVIKLENFTLHLYHIYIYTYTYIVLGGKNTRKANS